MRGATGMRVEATGPAATTTRVTHRKSTGSRPAATSAPRRYRRTPQNLRDLVRTNRRAPWSAAHSWSGRPRANWGQWTRIACMRTESAGSRFPIRADALDSYVFDRIRSALLCRWSR